MSETGLFVAYAALGVMAIVPIYLGSFNSIRKVEKEVEDSPEVFSMEDAKLFPIYGSATLFSLYLLFTYFNKDYINYILTAYFCLLGVVAMINTVEAVVQNVFGVAFEGDYRFEISKKQTEIISYRFGHFQVLLLVISIIIAALYAFSKNWIISNFYGEAFATSAIQLLKLDSFKTGMILLSGLFLYDVFWVFGTDVMVTVAKSFDAPIKVIWPRNIISLIESNSWLTCTNASFTMLGLGDIVIPGIYISLCLKFDYEQHIKKNALKTASSPETFPKPYFIASMIAYIFGLATTMFVMHTFKAAQPALLYLSPACIISTLLTAVVRGEIGDVFDFDISSPEVSSPKKNEETVKKSQSASPSKEAAVSSSRRRRKKSE